LCCDAAHHSREQLAALFTPEVKTICDALARSGVQTRIVGGAVRDVLSGLPPSDIDLVAGCGGSALIAACKQSALKFELLKGGDGTQPLTTVLMWAKRADSREKMKKHEALEISSIWEGIAAPDDNIWRRDASVRDFTMNAMSATSDGQLYDYFGGAQDINMKRLRWLGCIQDRIVENPLRILRFFRFHARFVVEDPHDPDVLRTMASEAHRMRELSGEAIWKAVKQILKGSSAHAGAVELRAMLENGFLLEVLPQSLQDDARLDVDAALKVRALQEKAALWTLFGKPVPINPVLTVVELFCRDSAVLHTVALAWKWSREEAELGSFLCANLGQNAPTLEECRRWLRVPDNFEPQEPQILQLTSVQPRLCLREWLIAEGRFSELEELEKVQPANFPVVTMRKLGLPKLKDKAAYIPALQRVKQLWVDSNCRLSASELLEARELWIPNSEGT